MQVLSVALSLILAEAHISAVPFQCLVQSLQTDNIIPYYTISFIGPDSRNPASRGWICLPLQARTQSILHENTSHGGILSCIGHTA